MTGGTSTRWRGDQALPTPRPIEFVRRHEDIPHRTCRWFARSEADARAQPSCRAIPSGVHVAKPPPGYRRSTPGLRTDSFHPPFLVAHTRHTLQRTIHGVVLRPTKDERARETPPRHPSHAHVSWTFVRSRKLLRRIRSARLDADAQRRTAGRAASVPPGSGANRRERPEGRSLRFAPPTPPWRRHAPNEGVEESHIYDLARALT